MIGLKSCGVRKSAHEVVIYFCSWSREEVYVATSGEEEALQCSAEWTEDMEVSLTQAFASLFPWIRVKHNCGMADQSRSQPGKVGIVMLTDSFSGCCSSIFIAQWIYWFKSIHELMLQKHLSIDISSDMAIIRLLSKRQTLRSTKMKVLFSSLRGLYI